MYFTSGSDRAFEQLMQTRPGADHFDNGEAGAPEDCGTCRFYRPHWKYQFCVYGECPYQPGKLNKTHFMVELSPYFVQIASSKDTDRLFSMLPYKPLCFTGMKDRHGLYAVINKDESRDKEVVRRPRASIRRQLSETKQAKAPKKAPARTKKNELEV